MRNEAREGTIPSVPDPIRRPPVQIPRPSARWLRAVVDGPFGFVEQAFGLAKVESLAQRIESGDPSIPVMERVLEATGIRPKCEASEFERIPATGSVLVCSNHPLGGADSTALLGLALRRRRDVKILTNGILSRFPFLAEHCIFVDPFGGADAARRNAHSLREALAWLKAGHALLAFPAGEVSARAWGRWAPCDPPWSTIPARMALAAKARVVPVWCEGSNSEFFHAAGLVHPRLRTALLPSEFVARLGAEVEFHIGRGIATDALNLDAEALTRLVRGRSELLRSRAPVERLAAPMEPVAASESTREELAAEFAALPASSLLFAEAGYEVFVARASQFPRAMREIGRLRELAFRAVGEGTGRACDIDRFDETYEQIVVWHPGNREIVGGYRAGTVAEVTRDAGVSGLYTSTLFDYSPRIVAELGDAVELGRSFVRPEYQRQPLPLSFLWRGIGVFMLTRGLRRMFGPVSISNDYTSMSQELIMQFLERHRLSAPFAPLVKPRNPRERLGIAGWTEREAAEATKDLLQVERLVEEIERGQRAVPVLLRQYLRLNARLLAFNVDPDFGDVVDALMIVDLTQIDDRIIRHYAGDAGLAAFRLRYAERSQDAAGNG